MDQKLSIKNLNFKEILNDINIDLNSGETLAIMGKNSSGKTTLLKCIFGLLDYKGEIFLNQGLISENNLFEMKKKFGICLGIENLSAGTVYSNLEKVLNNLNYSKKDTKKKIYDTSKKVGIDDLLYKEISQLSSSQKCVVALIKSIIHEPSVLLIDDIFSSLDRFYKNKVITYLKQIKKKDKVTIIIIINDSEYLDIVDKLAILKDGKIVEDGPVKELIKRTNILNKNNIKIPFIIDLSNKLKAYELINDDIYDMNEMVDEVWK